MELDILIKSVYGETKYYPQCNKSEIFAKISKTKTLSNHQLAWITSLGYKINYFTLVDGKPLKIAQ